MQEEIIKVMMQFPYGSPIEPKGVLSKWRNDYGVLARGNVRYLDWLGRCSNKWEKNFMEIDKGTLCLSLWTWRTWQKGYILTIGLALWRFRHALNKFYVQPGVSPSNRFGFITPNEWNTFQQLHTTPEAMVRSNTMKELIRKNKFKHRLGPGGYKATIPLWTKKE
jgi:hypothetical protein